MKLTSEKVLTVQEKRFAIRLSKDLLFFNNKSLAVKGDDLAHAYNTNEDFIKEFPQIKLNQRKIQFLVNYIRAKGMIKNLLGGTGGYWVSSDADEINHHVRSIYARINQISLTLGSFDTTFGGVQQELV